MRVETFVGQFHELSKIDRLAKRKEICASFVHQVMILTLLAKVFIIIGVIILNPSILDLGQQDILLSHLLCDWSCCKIKHELAES
jgi:hypothetical protein